MIKKKEGLGRICRPVHTHDWNNIGVSGTFYVSAESGTLYFGQYSGSMELDEIWDGIEDNKRQSHEIHEVGSDFWTRNDQTLGNSGLRSSLRKFLPGRMNECSEYSINRDKRELDETASSRSSFADLFDNSIAVEIRDGSYQREGYNLTTTTLLQTCKRQVVLPYLCMLSLITWRPFRREVLRYQQMWRVLNVIYTFFIFVLLIFSYVASILACQARLDTLVMSTESPATISSSTPAATTNASLHNHTTPATATMPTKYSAVPPNTPNSSKYNQSTMMPQPFFTLATAQIAAWSPAVRECTHIFSAYIVPNLFHFLAFVMGFYHFRIQESEALHVLIEKVFLYCSVPSKIVTRLRGLLIGGAVWVSLEVGNYILFCNAFGLSSVTGIHHSVRLQVLAVCVMVLGKLVESFITLVIIMNFCAQCQLLIYYLNEINLHMEEKTTDLNHAMKDMLDVKKNIDRINGVISWITTLIIFNHCEIAALGLSILGMQVNGFETTSQMVFRIARPVLCFLILCVPIAMASSLTAAGIKLKQKSLQIRMFGYSSASQLDLDSLILFSHCADLKVKLFFIPVKPSYIWGLISFIVFMVLLLLQMGVIGANNRFL